MGAMADKCVKVFADELGYIQDPKIKEFVIRCYDILAPETFFERPASLTGKYDPELSSGFGGLVRHTKYAVWWVIRLERALDTNGTGDGEYRDTVVAALILHDLLKDGDPMKAHLPERQGKQSHKLITGVHGIDMAQAIWERVLKGNVEWPEQLLIMHCIAAHMGVWTIGEEYKPNNIKDPLARKLAQIVQTADYCAAQKVEEALAHIGSQCKEA